MMRVSLENVRPVNPLSVLPYGICPVGQRSAFPFPEEGAVKSRRQDDRASHGTFIESQVKGYFAFGRGRHAADALQVRRLWSDKHLAVPGSIASYARDAGVEMPERMGSPSVAVAAGRRPGRFENRREIPVKTVLPESKVSEKEVGTSELEVRGIEIVLVVDGSPRQVIRRRQRRKAPLGLFPRHHIRKESQALRMFAEPCLRHVRRE